VRRPQAPVAERIADVGEANVLTSVIVACELRYGAARRGSRKLTAVSRDRSERDHDSTPRV
jgi:tRNA(fMet)-specific endonuclease VapC